MVTISKSTYISNIWKNFYDILSDATNGVKTVTLADATSQTIQTYTSSFPDRSTDDRSDYPIIIVNSPKTPEDKFTLGKERVTGTIKIDVYSTKSEASELFLDAIRNKIETYKDDLAALGLKPIKVEDTDGDSFMRGEIKLHVKSIIFAFEYKYTKTRAW